MFYIILMKFATLALLGVTAAHPEVQCPFGHRHRLSKKPDQHGHSIHAFRWGMVDMLDDEGQHIKHVHYDTSLESKSKCPITKWWENKVEHYRQYHELVNEFTIEEEQTEGCPFMKNFIKSNRISKEIHEKHAHKSPFYDSDAQEPEDVPETTWSEDDEDTGIPTAVFHGFGDACINPGMINFNRELKKGTKGKVKCIEVGWPSFGEVFNNAESVA